MQACNKPKLLQWALHGLYNQKGLGYSQHTHYTHQMKIEVGLLTLLE